MHQKTAFMNDADYFLIRYKALKPGAGTIFQFFFDCVVWSGPVYVQLQSFINLLQGLCNLHQRFMPAKPQIAQIGYHRHFILLKEATIYKINLRSVHNTAARISEFFLISVPQQRTVEETFRHIRNRFPVGSAKPCIVQLIRR